MKRISVSKQSSILLVLYNIRSVYNVGSLFRTADGAGVNEILLVGYTPCPIDRFGRVRSDLHKTALGAEENVKWQYFKDWKSTVEYLNSEKYKIVAIEQNKKSISYEKIKVSKKNNVALILGPEVEGLPKEILNEVDTIIEIPMYGKKESLNVSVAGGIVLYEVVRKLQKREL